MANHIQLVMYEGYLAADPEMRYTPTGTAVTNFRIGSTRQYKSKEGETVKETTWLKVAAWGKLAEIVNQLCAKGSHVIVTGNLRGGKNGSPNVYQLSTGENAASFEITAREIRVIKGKDNVQEQEQPFDSSDDDGEIPF